MGHVVVELQIMIAYSVVDMIQLEKVFQCSCSLFTLSLNVVHLDRGDIDGYCMPCRKKLWQTEGKGELRKGREHGYRIEIVDVQRTREATAALRTVIIRRVWGRMRVRFLYLLKLFTLPYLILV